MWFIFCVFLYVLYTLPTKVYIVKATVFPVMTYGCESWTIKKAECWRIDAYELWCQRRLLRVPWTARISNNSILKEINPEFSLEWLMLKLKLQYFGHLMQRANSLGKNPDAGKDWRQEEKRITEDEMVGWHHRLNGHEFQQALGDGEEQGSLVCCSPWGYKESDMTEQLNNNIFFTHIILHIIYVIYFIYFIYIKQCEYIWGWMTKESQKCMSLKCKCKIN